MKKRFFLPRFEVYQQSSGKLLPNVLCLPFLNAVLKEKSTNFI